MLTSLAWSVVGFLCSVGAEVPKITEQELRSLFETCVAATGKGYEAAAEKIDEVNQHRRVYEGPPPKYNQTWQERWVQRILLARSANPQRVWEPGMAYRACQRPLRIRPSEGTLRERLHTLPPPLAISPHSVPVSRESSRGLLWDSVSIALPGDVEFLWKLSAGTEAWQRIRAAECILGSSGVHYWEDLGYGLTKRHPYVDRDPFLLPDLGELLMYALERESDAWVVRELQEALATLPDERVLDAVRKRASDTKLAEATRQRLSEVVSVMQEYHRRLRSNEALTTRDAGTTKPSP